MSADRQIQVEFRYPLRPEHRFLLTSDAVNFLVNLTLRFRPRIEELLIARKRRQAEFDNGARPAFLKNTEDIRNANWTVASIPADLEDRRVEITGPVERKMIINALNSGAKTFMADFEDSNSPTFDNCITGQINLYEAVRRTITYDDPASQKHYKLNPNIATLIVRPRGFHLVEGHVLVGGGPIPAPLFDFGLYFYHNASELLGRGSGPYFYLPKMESRFEARLWNDIFIFAQQSLKIPIGSIRATALIETLPAAFEMDEILYELRAHSSGLNCGRWDYIFSFIKTFAAHANMLIPDRAQVTMDQRFLRSYTQLLIKTCHRRNAHAIGGMAAQIPIKNDPAANEAALEKVRLDKLREATDGHDGTWVAHPGLVPLAMEVFDRLMPAKNQIDRKREDLSISEGDLLQLPKGSRTEAGLRHNISVGIQYLESWLRGLGCVPIYNLMEDAATAEISRTQVWQWLHHGANLADGRIVTRELIDQLIDSETAAIRAGYDSRRLAANELERAKVIFRDLCMNGDCPRFLTIKTYDALMRASAASRSI
ncbi:MAG: malate synthase A [Planctomycetes bacterium]|nr:malate synthase A [Planctomycetota bacterium]